MDSKYFSTTKKGQLGPHVSLPAADLRSARGSSLPASVPPAACRRLPQEAPGLSAC